MLKELVAAVPGAEVVREGNPEISTIAYDSRRVGPGALFVAVPGFAVDGHNFLPDAAARGATAVVVQADHLANISSLLDDLPAELPVVAVPDSRHALALMSAAFFGYPARQMKVVGVTGTDGKTTTTYLITALLEAAGHRVGLMGTVGIKVGEQVFDNPERHTTPESTEVQEILAQARDAGAEYAVIETSSHALELERVTGCEYDVSVITNVTGDHLDFHGSYENYLAAKAKLFSMLGDAVDKGVPKTAVLNLDDPRSFDTLRAAAGSARIMTYAIEAEATVSARDLELQADGARFTLVTPEGSIPIQTHLPARYNVSNCLAAAAAVLALGVPLETIARGLAEFQGVPGRMERIASGQPFSLIVDYAHTPDSMRKMLQNMRAVAKGRLLVVFGAIGGRDQHRRSGLANVISEIADLAFITNEDPHHEPAEQILADIADAFMKQGWQEGERFWRQADRQEAILMALQAARPDDIVLLTGKGHEQSIIIGDEATPWDDREAARTALRRLGFG